MRSLLILAFLTGPAFADPTPPTPAPTLPTRAGGHDDDCTIARKLGKTCVLTIGNEDITSDRPTIGDLDVRSIVFGKLNSLLPIRRDFIKEIVKTAEDLD